MALTPLRSFLTVATTAFTPPQLLKLSSSVEEERRSSSTPEGRSESELSTRAESGALAVMRMVL